MPIAGWCQPVLGLLAAPLLLGIINRVKALFAGRQGPPLIQPYRDLYKLLGKGATYSKTTTLVFRLAPAAGLACVVLALTLLPLGASRAVLAFPGDLVLLIYLLGLVRFLTVIGALDTGSSFEGMGASREVQFSALAEPVLLLVMAGLARQGDSLSLSGIYPAVTAATWMEAGPALALIAAALLVVLLAENSRIPVDDPNTHLELTMIHEVMVLDYSGPDLAAILYGASLKLWVFGSLLVGVCVPVRTGWAIVDVPAFLAGMLVVAVLVGVVESIMARLRLLRVPQLLIGAGAMAMLALVLVVR
ncbi:MAG TPA: NADH-quinone oxidoreductase subunit H [Phycisphaerae bacterium]|nr:NADH-quinone oxidoreductase subunit H [Phycisphaerae bacterium]HOJ73799.1 NADH-quinone oxidoreductase subunit H [Phycisphaerae bacterium]HOM50446.1 NADH-quinone oxidoreductase subunit H [Phycisphaerae bacterium]HON65425.1 NADH-quinone oxidoreductase subunit H [Phycisphaerae bacterium]HOQ85698.1 NADH-quinone oxidoreductase subunit H [Phycisphaerae bacterium]